MTMSMLVLAPINVLHEANTVLHGAKGIAHATGLCRDAASPLHAPPPPRSSPCCGSGGTRTPPRSTAQPCGTAACSADNRARTGHARAAASAAGRAEGPRDPPERFQAPPLALRRRPVGSMAARFRAGAEKGCAFKQPFLIYDDALRRMHEGEYGTRAPTSIASGPFSASIAVRRRSVLS
jgi:hypothetical protein